MNRFHRRLHLIAWLVVGPVCLALLWLAMNAQPAGDESFGISERAEVAE